MKHFALLAASLMLFASCAAKLDELHETVTIKGSVGNLVGEIDRPAVNSSKCPTIIYYHGLTGYRSENHIMAVRDSLLANGIAVVRFDFNGHGESEGPFSGMTLDNEVEDAELILDYVYSLKWTDKDRIGIAGHSQGGLVSSVVAGDLGKEKVKCEVLMAPAACIHRYCTEGTWTGGSTDPENMPDSIQFWGGRFLGKAYVISGINMDVHERASHYDGPACVIQGTADSPELVEDAAKYMDSIDDCEYWGLEGLTHCYPEDYATPAHIAADFVLRKFGMSDAPDPAPVKLVMETTKGDIHLTLCDRTPLHRDNFLKLAENHEFDSLLFHRVIKDFMIQGGDPDSKHAAPGQQLGDGDKDYRIPAEFRLDRGIYHKRGALAAARENDDVNPQQQSSAMQFYIVWGKVFDDEGLKKFDNLTDEMRETYKTVGGTPHLDGRYTVFGEVTDGLDVVDAIQNVPTDSNDRPVEDVRIIRVYREN